MTPETIIKIRDLLPTISDVALIQFDALIQAEMIRRGAKLKRPPKHNRFWETKDCEPNHGD